MALWPGAELFLVRERQALISFDEIGSRGRVGRGRGSSVEKPSWLRSFQTQLSSSDQVPTNATGKDPGHRTMVIIILCNCILHNISDQIVAVKTQGRDPEKKSAWRKIAMDGGSTQ